MPNPQALLEKIQALPAERIAEVEDFVDFVTARENERVTRRAAGVMSEPAFARVWENAEDDVYDAI